METDRIGYIGLTAGKFPLPKCVTMEPSNKIACENSSCDSRLSRKDFLRRFVAPTVGAVILLQPPKIVDKFTLQPQAAAASPLQFTQRGYGGGTKLPSYHRT
jgi:hypothetical protein